MGIKCDDLRNYIVKPTLLDLGLYSLTAENLLLGTCAQESAMGTYLKQTNGVALGIYQIEPKTHADLWSNFLLFPKNSKIMEKVSSFCNADHEESLLYNLKYATAIARLIYYRHADPLPAPDDITGMATLYKKRYNTPNGKATEQQFIDNYRRYVL